MSLTAAMVIGPTITFAVPNRANEINTVCQPTGKQTPNGGEEVECCWTETVPPGTGYGGSNFEMYCNECENGGTRGYINCSDPSLQYRDGKPGASPGIPPTGGISDDPKADDDRNPGIPPTEGIEDGIKSNNDNEGGNNEDSSNTIPRKGGNLGASDLSENVIGQ